MGRWCTGHLRSGRVDYLWGGGAQDTCGVEELITCGEVVHRTPGVEELITCGEVVEILDKFGKRFSAAVNI